MAAVVVVVAGGATITVVAHALLLQGACGPDLIATVLARIAMDKGARTIHGSATVAVVVVGIGVGAIPNARGIKGVLTTVAVEKKKSKPNKNL
jgi:hypothetical protein